ncbi:hypothetical protein IMSAGC003_00039 [Lachnospiraceae bacterium]|nr:hypothetical protein IMSAGC003_00039 [Lachnospiraceae bacterium]
MAEQNSRRITWIDGLKGIACLLIFTHHFSLEYFNGAYFGEAMESRLPFRLDIRLSYEPYGILTNGNFWVCVFVTLAAFLTAAGVLRQCAASQRGDWQEKLSGMIIKRYVRLAVPCGAAGILYWLLRQFLVPRFACYRGLENILSFEKMLWHTFVKMWIVPDQEALGPYWMLYIIFWGTFMAIILSLATRYTKKWTLPFFFAIASLLLWARDEYYLCVVVGVLLAWLMNSGVLADNRRNRWLALLPLVGGLYLGGYPSYATPVFFYRYLGKLCPYIYGGKGIATYHILGAGLLILGILMSVPVQRGLSARPLRWLGSVSMGVFVLHVTVMQFAGRPLRDWLLGMGLSYPLTVLLVFLALLAVLLPAAWGYKNSVERLLEKGLRRL